MAERDVDREKMRRSIASFFGAKEEPTRDPAGLTDDLKKQLTENIKNLGAVPNLERQPLPDIRSEEAQLGKILGTSDPNLTRKAVDETEAGFEPRYKEETPGRREVNEKVQSTFDMLRGGKPSTVPRRAMEEPQEDAAAPAGEEETPWYKSDTMKNLAMALGPAAAIALASKAGGKYGVEWGQGLGSGLERGFKDYMKRQQQLKTAAAAKKDKEADRELKKASILIDKMAVKQRQYDMETARGDKNAARTYEELKVIGNLLKQQQDVTSERLEIKRKGKADVADAGKKGREEYNKARAKDIAAYVKARPQLIQLIKNTDKAMAKIKAIKPSRYLGLVPEKAAAFFNSQAAALKQSIDKDTVRKLKETMGAQFTEKENKMYRDLAYDPLLTNQQNYDKQIAAYEEFVNIIAAGDKDVKDFQAAKGDVSSVPLKEFKPKKPEPFKDSGIKDSNILNYAKKYKLTPEKAQEILLKRGYKGQ